MKQNFLSQTGRYAVCVLKYLLYLFNLVLLAGLGVKTVSLWITTPFEFSDTLAAFPDEPEFIDKVSAEKQFWSAASFETLILVIGGFVCYELLIKRKSFRRGITAPLMLAFLWTAGESAFLFLPATGKVQTIRTCLTMNISWDKKNHKCRLMDLELRRFETLKALKASRRKPVQPVAKPEVENDKPPVPEKVPDRSLDKENATETVKPVESVQTVPAPVVVPEKAQNKPAVKEKIKESVNPALKKGKPKPTKKRKRKNGVVGDTTPFAPKPERP